MHSRIVHAVVVAISAVLVVAAPARAQDYPNKRITLIVPLPPGASADGTARILAERLAPRLGQSVVVDNKSGAGSFIGSDFVAKAAPDGYTLLMGGQPLTAPKPMRMVPDFDPDRLASLGRVAISPFLVVVPAELPVNTLPEFLSYARTNSGKVNYGVVPGAAMQLDMAMFEQSLKAPLTAVPFNGASPIATALLSNTVQMSFLGVSAIPSVKAGKLKALAVTQAQRWGRMPEVPSMAELGINFHSGYWYGLAAPAGTPKPIMDRLALELAEVMKMQEVKDLIVKLGMDPMEPSPAEMDAAIRDERQRNEDAMKLLKVQK
jgi:tripartite-type tricarboxylate transporter receptor subunit TctC